MEGRVEPVLQPRQSPQSSSQVFLRFAPKIVELPGWNGKWGRKRKVYLTRPIMSFYSVPLGWREGRGTVQRRPRKWTMAQGPAGRWSLPDVSLLCTDSEALLSVSQLFPQNVARSHESSCGCSVAALWLLCGSTGSSLHSQVLLVLVHQGKPWPRENKRKF